MSRSYASLGMFQSEMRVPAKGPGSLADVVALRFLERATAEIEKRTGRRFDARAGETAYYRGISAEAPYLWIGDWVSITSVAQDAGDDGTYELALVEGADYWTIREGDDAERPITRLELMMRGTQLGAWATVSRAIKIVGMMGYSNESEPVITDDGTAVSGTLADDTATSLVLSVSGHGVTPGDTLPLEDEQVYVAGKIDDVTVRVARAQNGTTAAAHTGAAVSRRRYPREIEAACVMRAADLMRGAQTGFAATEGEGFQSRTAFAQFMGLLAPYMRTPVGIG